MPNRRLYNYTIKLETISTSVIAYYVTKLSSSYKQLEVPPGSTGKEIYRSSSVFYLSPILFVRKVNKGLRICVNYRKFNKTTKKDRYPLSLITKIEGAKYFTKIDIIVAFNEFRMAKAGEDLTTFEKRVLTYKNI